MQVDMTLLILYWGIPLLIIGARAALAAWQVRQRRKELRQIEERSTPITGNL